MLLLIVLCCLIAVAYLQLPCPIGYIPIGYECSRQAGPCKTWAWTTNFTQYRGCLTCYGDAFMVLRSSIRSSCVPKACTQYDDGMARCSQCQPGYSLTHNYSCIINSVLQLTTNSQNSSTLTGQNITLFCAVVCFVFHLVVKTPLIQNPYSIKYSKFESNNNQMQGEKLIIQNSSQVAVKTQSVMVRPRKRRFRQENNMELLQQVVLETQLN